jgi:hypothetical protein
MAITNNGAVGLSADAVATLTNKTLTSPTISNATFTGQQTGLELAFSQSIVFEGTTADAFETTLSAGEPTADRVITLPDITDTLVGKTTTDTLTNKTLTSPVITGATFNDGSIVFEGATANDFETTLAITDPTADRTITFPDATGTVVLRDSTDTLTNKTLTTPIISSISNTGTLTLPTSTDTLVGRDTTDTLTNKTLASPTFTGQVTGLEIAFSQNIVFEGTTADSFETTLTAGEPTADRTINLPDASGTLALSSSIDATVSTVNGLEIAVIMAAF